MHWEQNPFKDGAIVELMRILFIITITALFTRV
jgi:hypothetical protein